LKGLGGCWCRTEEGKENTFSDISGMSRGRIFSRVGPFYQRAVSDLDP
jgi:hypothetical protein